jgi:hypothetical protein
LPHAGAPARLRGEPWDRRITTAAQPAIIAVTILFILMMSPAAFTTQPSSLAQTAATVLSTMEQ